MKRRMKRGTSESPGTSTTTETAVLLILMLLFHVTVVTINDSTAAPKYCYRNISTNAATLTSASPANTAITFTW